MFTTYECEFRWPQYNYIYLKNIYVPINPTKAVEALEQREHKPQEKICENDKKDDAHEFPMHLEWTSTAPSGGLIDRKLIPVNKTDEEQREINRITDSDDFNFLPCPHKKADKPMEAAVRSISAQTGIAYDELMKDVYEQRDQWQQTAIGQAEVDMRDYFEKRRNGKSPTKEMVF
uniref:DNA mismatch repair protein MutS n=1 Tax=Zeugodacus cucurbitae TaxID=28588 RepID=A0A0A1XC86_ZEUCU